MPTVDLGTLNNPDIVQPDEPYLILASMVDVEYYFTYDSSGPTFTDYTAEANSAAANDAPLIPAGIGIDRHFVGHSRRFMTVMYQVGTAGTGGYTGAFAYSQGGGSWSAWTDYFDAIADLNNFKTAQTSPIFLLPPADFAPNTVDGVSAYWVRYQTDSGSVTVQPLADRIRVELYPPGAVSGQVMKVMRG